MIEKIVGGLMLLCIASSSIIKEKIKVFDPSTKTQEELIDHFGLDKHNFYTHVKYRDIPLKERAEKYNKDNNLRIPISDYPYLVFGFYTEDKAFVSAVVNRLAASRINSRCKQVFVGNKCVDISFEDVISKYQNFSAFNSGSLHEQIENMTKSNNMADFLIHGKNYKGNFYDYLLKDYCLKGKDIPKRVIDSLKYVAKGRAHKLWKSINYTERNIAESLKDSWYDEEGFQTLYYKNRSIANNSLWNPGDEAFPGAKITYLGEIGAHEVCGIEYSKLDMDKAREKLTQDFTVPL